jgi:hypothetical protein
MTKSPPRRQRRFAEAAIEERDGVVVFTPVKPLRDPLSEGLVEELEVLIAGHSAIVDLSETTLVSAGPMIGLAAWIVATSERPDQCCLVSPRATARALLRRWHVTRCLTVFGSIGDALQARRFDNEGYGSGWHPDSQGI